MELLYSSHVNDTLFITDNDVGLAFQRLVVANDTFTRDSVVLRDGERGNQWPEIESQVVSQVVEHEFFVTPGLITASTPTE